MVNNNLTKAYIMEIPEGEEKKGKKINLNQNVYSISKFDETCISTESGCSKNSNQNKHLSSPCLGIL